MRLYTESIVDQTNHYPDAFVSQKYWVWLCCYDNIMTVENLQLTPFCLEKSSIRKGVF